MPVKDYTETAHAAGRVSKQSPVGVTVEHKSLETVKVDFSEIGYLPPEVPAELRSHGFVLEAVFGTSADFKHADHPRV